MILKNERKSVFMLYLLSIGALSDRIVSGLSASMGNYYHLLYNAIGVISIVTQFMIFQMKGRSRIILVNIASNLGWLLYFALQGDLLSGAANVIGILSNIIYIFRTKYRWASSRLWLLFFLLVAGVYSVLTFRVWNDVFPLVACLLSMIAFFMIKEVNISRISFFTYIMFMCNSISKLYIVALIADVTALISVLISLYRHRRASRLHQAEAQKQ